MEGRGIKIKMNWLWREVVRVRVTLSMGGHHGQVGQSVVLLFAFAYEFLSKDFSHFLLCDTLFHSPFPFLSIFIYEKMTSIMRRRSRLSGFPTRVKFITFSFAMLCLWSYLLRPSFNGPPAGTFSVEGSPVPTRQTLSNDDDNCNVSDFERNGGVVLYFVGILYVFLGLAIICDEYFVSSLEEISEVLHLSEDVAGATFMAAGSSAPEFFTSMADAFIARNGIGIGTIIGSAIFNILVIVGVTGAAAGRILDLDGWPLGRDAIFYAVSIIAMSACYWNGSVEWWEALSLVLCYGVYVLFMKFDSSLRDRFKPPTAKEEEVEGGESDEEEAVATEHEMKEIESVPGEQEEPDERSSPSSSPPPHQESTANRASVSLMVGKRFPWHREISFRDMKVSDEDITDDETQRGQQGRRVVSNPSDDEDEEDEEGQEGEEGTNEPSVDEKAVEEEDIFVAIPLEDDKEFEEKGTSSPSEEKGTSSPSEEKAVEEEEEEEHRPWYALNWPESNLSRFVCA
jgi:Ca2+/Na+ antiporter